MTQKSDSIANLAMALAKAQAEMPVVKFDAKNPFLKNKYATLGAVIEASRPVLKKHGLAVSQFPYGFENTVGVTTILIHESGEWIEENISLELEVGKGLSNNQSAGVTLTYLRRYAYAAILGITADEDGDGDLHASNEANEKVAAVMKREWTPEQTEAISLYALDNGMDVMDESQVLAILDQSVLPGDVSPKTIQSWFKHFAKAEGTDFARATVANDAYMQAKKGTKNG